MLNRRYRLSNLLKQGLSVDIILFFMCVQLSYIFVYRTAGSVMGAGFQAFISDWDKVTAAVSSCLHASCVLYQIGTISEIFFITFENEL